LKRCDAQGTWSGELIHHTKDGRALTVESHIELVAMDGRRLVLESTRDITDQKRWEERRMLLIRELGHRVGNTVAVVQSMAHQMLLTTPPADFAQIFEGRLAALANSHRLMIEGQWQGADLREIAESQLSAHMSDDPPRLRMAGAPLRLGADVATPLGLIFHELATNAVKYGALSTLGGQVDLRWTLSGKNLQIIWQETGGPPVQAPAHQGLGGLLIEQGLPGASVRRDFAGSGLTCTIDVELPAEGDDAN
jgi:two-component system CheB/CheR fusion protein